MKKFFLFFAIFTIFVVLSAQGTENEPVSSQNEIHVEHEAVNNSVETAPEEAPAVENQEGETQNVSKEEKTPETAEEKPEESVSAETKAEPAQPAETKAAVSAQTQPEAVENRVDEHILKEGKPDKFFFLPTIGAGSGYGVFNVNAGFWMNVLVNRTKSGNNTYLGIKTYVGYTPLDFGYNIIMFPIELNALVDFKVENDVLAYLGWWFSAGIGLSWEIERYYDDDEGENEFFKNMAWGTGLSLLFKNRITFIAGINGNPRRYFDINFAVGYRF